MRNLPNVECGVRNVEFRCRFTTVFLITVLVKKVVPQALLNSTLRIPNFAFEVATI